MNIKEKHLLKNSEMNVSYFVSLFVCCQVHMRSGDSSYECDVSSVSGGTIECTMNTENTMPPGEVFQVFVTVQPVG